VTFGKNLNGAGRFGIGLDFRLSPKFDLGGEVGTIRKHDVGILGSGNLTYHFTGTRGRREEWDPFLVGGVSAARISGTSGLYLNLGADVNYWFSSRFACGASSRATLAARTLEASPNSVLASLSGRRT
jgi:hypothetical protein